MTHHRVDVTVLGQKPMADAKGGSDFKVYPKGLKVILIRMVRFIIEHDEITGPVNGTSPAPARMKDFSKILGEVLKRPSWFPVPGFVLKIALGQMSEMLLHGQRAIPQKISDIGFEFKFPDLRSALEDALGNRNVV